MISFPKLLNTSGDSWNANYPKPTALINLSLIFNKLHKDIKISKIGRSKENIGSNIEYSSIFLNNFIN